MTGPGVNQGVYVAGTSSRPTWRPGPAPVADRFCLARRERGESIRTIAAGVKASVGVVHKTLTEALPGSGSR